MLILSWIETRRRYQKLRRDHLRVFRREIKSAFDSLSADFQESNLALLASPLPDRPNYFHPKELYIHHAVGLHLTDVLMQRSATSKESIAERITPGGGQFRSACCPNGTE